MAWFSYNRLYPVLEWLWRRLALIWCCVTRMSGPIVGYAFLAIGWRRERGGRDEPQVPEEDQIPGGRFPHEVEETQECEGQPETAAGERAAESKRERPECEEEDDEEFDSERYRVETTDELYCDYDSTWEDEDHQKSTFNRTRRPAASRYYKFRRFETAAQDMQNYRHDYPYQTNMHHWGKPASNENPNLNFYLGLTPSAPDGIYIGNFHRDWSGEYDTLEYVHTYIQWLFPLQEPGVNYEANTLTKEEIKEFLKNSTAKENLLKSYKLMLDFYGIELCSEKTGEVKRASNWKERFRNLDSHTHNSLRITRILKCQGTLGYPHFQAPLVRFFLEETLVHRELPNIKDSVLNYFVFAVLDKRQRRRLIKYAYLNYDCKDEFVWCPKKIQMIWSRSVSAEAKEMHWSV